MRELRDGLCFPLRPERLLDEFLARGPKMHLFDGNGASQELIGRAPHGPHAAPAELAQQQVPVRNDPTFTNVTHRTALLTRAFTAQRISVL